MIIQVANHFKLVYLSPWSLFSWSLVLHNCYFYYFKIGLLFKIAILLVTRL